MIAVDAGWLEAANHSHRPVWNVDVLDAAGQVRVPGLPVTGGQLTMDEGRTPRTEANVDVPATAVPTLMDEAYLPGGRLRLSYAIHPWPAVVVADLDIVASAIARPEDMWTLAAVDRGARVGMDDLARTAPVALGGLIAGDAVAALVRRTFPGDPVDVTGRAGIVRLPADWDAPDTGSPWREAENVAAHAEAEVFYDRVTRRCTVRGVPDIGAPVDEVAVGVQLTGYTVKHELGYTTTVHRFEDKADGVVRGVHVDTRAGSPTALARVGSHVTAARSTTVGVLPSQAQADSAALAASRRSTGRARAAELRHPARPWLDPGDTIRVTFLGGPTEDYVIESIGVDLGPANIQVTRLRNHHYTLGGTP